MEKTDKDIMRNILARKVGKVVAEMISKESYDGGIDMTVIVDTPTCYIGDDGNVRSGRLVIVNVDLNDSEATGDDDEE